MTTTTAAASIDMTGKTITTFILCNAHSKLRDLKEGDVLEIVTDTFEPIENDIGAWCRMAGHELVALEKGPDRHSYYVAKGSPRETEHKLGMVISDPGLEQLLSPLGFALAAALGGSDVHLYFQGPAVRVPRRGFSAKLSGIGRPFSGFARRGMAKVGHVPPQEKLGQLKELGAHFYICGPSMQHFGVKKDELIFDDIVMAEYLTFMEVMNKADVHIYP
jgi:predicted peroxiredoxin/TusA-related sulfurtransferase